MPHPAGSVDPARDARTMEDELILADLGVVERRLDRLEKDLKKNESAELEQRAASFCSRCREALETGRPLRALDLAGDDANRLRGFQFLSAKPLLLVINLDEAEPPRADAAAATRRHRRRSSSRAATRAVAICAKIELEIASSTRRTPPRSWPISACASRGSTA